MFSHLRSNQSNCSICYIYMYDLKLVHCIIPAMHAPLQLGCCSTNPFLGEIRDISHLCGLTEECSASATLQHSAMTLLLALFLVNMAMLL